MSVPTYTSKEKLAEITSYFAQYDSSDSSSEDEPTTPRFQKATSGHRSAYKFTVHLSKSLINATPYRAVIFDDIKINNDDCYNVTTGRFNAPVKGVYTFLLSMTMAGKEWPDLCIIHNFHPIDQSKVHSETSFAKDFGTKTQGVVITMEKNDDVWVLNVTRVTKVERLTGKDYTSFSGQLLTRL